MEFLVANWVFIVICVAVAAVACCAIYKFVKTPSQEQIKKVKEWLLYAVAEAERYLGSSTGELKLRFVYDLFMSKFPYLVAVISFDKFSHYVDEALDKFEIMLEDNDKVQEFVEM